MAGSQQPVNLVKYGKPELIHEDDFKKDNQGGAGCTSINEPFLRNLVREACREVNASQIDRDQILAAIVPPREFEEDGKFYRQMISKEGSNRANVLALGTLLNEQLSLRQARLDGICTVRRELFTQLFDELIRQVTLNQPERGLLLLRIRDELRMTLSAYTNLFVSARDHDPRLTYALPVMMAKDELYHRISEISPHVTDLQRQRDEMARSYENHEQIFREERESAYARHMDEYRFLKAIQRILKEQITSVVDPDDSVDPVIHTYKSVVEKEERGPWKIDTVCKDNP